MARDVLLERLRQEPLSLNAQHPTWIWSKAKSPASKDQVTSYRLLYGGLLFFVRPRPVVVVKYPRPPAPVSCLDVQSKLLNRSWRLERHVTIQFRCHVHFKVASNEVPESYLRSGQGRAQTLLDKLSQYIPDYFAVVDWGATCFMFRYVLHIQKERILPSNGGVLILIVYVHPLDI